eukprot:1725401-Ditylum_brightwellii.AAC.1
MSTIFFLQQHKDWVLKIGIPRQQHKAILKHAGGRLCSKIELSAKRTQSEPALASSDGSAF